MEEAVEGMLARYSMLLQSYSIDGKPTIHGKLLGLGTEEEREELVAFKDSLPEDAAMGDVGAALLQRTDISIEEFKKLYAQDVEKTTKANRKTINIAGKRIFFDVNGFFQSNLFVLEQALPLITDGLYGKRLR